MPVPRLFTRRKRSKYFHACVIGVQEEDLEVIDLIMSYEQSEPDISPDRRSVAAHKMMERDSEVRLRRLTSVGSLY